MPGRARGKNFCTKSAGDLHRYMANTTGTTMDQYLLPEPDPSPVDQTFPSGDQHQRQTGSLTHAQVVWFASQQSRVDHRVLGQ
ncbi:hypothetical protein D3C75_1225790 [compost metagenome]